MSEKRKYIRKVKIMEAYLFKSNHELAAIAENVIATLPNPFGSFEKATYSLFCYRQNGSRLPVYSFITTCHNTEDCMEILKKKFYDQQRREKSFTIKKSSNGKDEIIFRLKYVREYQSPK
jgi:hypothetical protein